MLGFGTKRPSIQLGGVIPTACLALRAALDLLYSIQIADVEDAKQADILNIRRSQSHNALAELLIPKAVLQGWPSASLGSYGCDHNAVGDRDKPGTFACQQLARTGVPYSGQVAEQIPQRIDVPEL